MPPVKKPKAKPIAKAVVAAKETTPVVSGQLKKKLQLREKRQKPKRGVVFIKHLPHGFFEDQIRRYFEQFGDVTRLRLARSKVTGGSKGFAFVEFDVPEVAEVAAETMDNYLMFNKVVKAAYIPPEKQAFNFFKTSIRKVKNKAGKPIYVSYKTADINRRVKKFNEWSGEAYQKRTFVKQRRIQKLNEKYAHLGIDFNSIIAGSKETDGKACTEKKPEDKTGTKKTKAAPSAEQKGKKSKKIVQLEDLLGTTLDDNDSDDHDFELESQDDNSDNEDETAPASKKKRTESVSLVDLLGDTLNEDSDESEYEINADEDNSDAEQQTGSSSEEEEELVEDEQEEENSDEEEVKQHKKTKPANKKDKKVNKPKVDHLDELIQHKKHAGGIQKSKRVAPKKAKFEEPKNAAQAELTKELAKPMKSLKKSNKQQNKKQKK